jgi:hypothetical protein
MKGAKLWKHKNRSLNVKPEPTDGNDLIAAIKEFETGLPDWWWTVGFCGVSRHASCGPDYSRIEDQLELKIFDNGFHFDDIAADSTVASSLRNVMRQAMEARAELSNHPATAIERYIETLMKSRGLSREKATARAANLEPKPSNATAGP